MKRITRKTKIRAHISLENVLCFNLLLICEFCMQYLAQCELSVSNLGVSKKNVDHGAAGAEVPDKNIHILYFQFVILDTSFADYIQAKLKGFWSYRQCSSGRIVWT